MSEHAIMILLGIASVATAVSGFSGVVAVFAGRNDGKWAPEERFRTANMLILSLGVVLLSFVPLIEELFQCREDILWISSSFLLAAFSTSYFLYTIRKIRKLNLLRRGILITWVRIVFFVCLGLSITLQLLNLFGILVERGSGPFVAGLMFVLIPAGLQFAFLVLTPLTSSES